MPEPKLDLPLWPLLADAPDQLYFLQAAKAHGLSPSHE